jgi:hypothetical protein
MEIARRRLTQKLSMSLEEVKSQWSKAGAALSDSPIGDAERERERESSFRQFLLFFILTYGFGIVDLRVVPGL